MRCQGRGCPVLILPADVEGGTAAVDDRHTGPVDGRIGPAPVGRTDPALVGRTGSVVDGRIVLVDDRNGPAAAEEGTVAGVGGTDSLARTAGSETVDRVPAAAAGDAAGEGSCQTEEDRNPGGKKVPAGMVGWGQGSPTAKRG